MAAAATASWDRAHAMPIDPLDGALRRLTLSEASAAASTPAAAASPLVLDGKRLPTPAGTPLAIPLPAAVAAAAPPGVPAAAEGAAALSPFAIFVTSAPSPNGMPSPSGMLSHTMLPHPMPPHTMTMPSHTMTMPSHTITMPTHTGTVLAPFAPPPPSMSGAFVGTPLTSTTAETGSVASRASGAPLPSPGVAAEPPSGPALRRPSYGAYVYPTPLMHPVLQYHRGSVDGHVMHGPYAAPHGLLPPRMPYALRGHYVQQPNGTMVWHTASPGPAPQSLPGSPLYPGVLQPAWAFHPSGQPMAQPPPPPTHARSMYQMPTNGLMVAAHAVPSSAPSTHSVGSSGNGHAHHHANGASSPVMRGGSPAGTTASAPTTPSHTVHHPAGPGLVPMMARTASPTPSDRRSLTSDMASHHAAAAAIATNVYCHSSSSASSLREDSASTPGTPPPSASGLSLAPPIGMGSAPGYALTLPLPWAMGAYGPPAHLVMHPHATVSGAPGGAHGSQSGGGSSGLASPYAASLVGDQSDCASVYSTSTSVVMAQVGQQHLQAMQQMAPPTIVTPTTPTSAGTAMGPASSASSSSTATPSAPRPSKPDPGAMYTELVALRTQAKASTDPAVQLAFCRTLLTVADALPRSPAALLALADQSGSRNLDPKKIRKQQDVLQHEALKHLKKLATHGNVQGVGKTPYADAQYLLAECYGHGRLGLSHDHERAFALYHAASKQGHAASTYRAAVCYEAGAGVKRDHGRAVSLYRKAAAMGDTAAMFRLGMIQLHGQLNVPVNPRDGIAWLKRAANQADEATPHALHELGMLYEGKTSGSAATVSSTHAAHSLSGTTNGASLAASAASPAAALSISASAGGMASSFSSSSSSSSLTPTSLPSSTTTIAPSILLPDPAYAHDLFLRAAQLAYAPSQYKLGLCHEYGLLNLTVDARRSIAWYAKAAEQGDPDAELALSGWYLTGADGILVQSDQEAYLWARKAADKGLAKAEYAVAYYTEHGVGVRANWDEARRWYLRASSQGHARAMARLKEAAQDGVKPAGKSAKVSGSPDGSSPTTATTTAAKKAVMSSRSQRRKDGDAKDSECSIM